MSYFKQSKPEPEEQEGAMALEELEKATLEELDEVKRGFRERTKQENERFRDVCDTEYWFCVSFNSRAQKEELLKKLGFDPDEKYLNGRDFAKKVNRALETPDMEFPKVRAFDKEYVGMSRKIDE